VIRELPDRLTPIALVDVQNQLLLQWETLGREPTRAAIELKLAHIKVETGLKYCHNYNLGNIKSVPGDGQCWQFFACGEEITKSELPKLEAQGPGLVRVVKEYTRKVTTKQGEIKIVPMFSVRIYPKHPGCRFRAYEDLAGGVGSQLRYLKQASHQDVLDALMTGDADVYCRALYTDHYYTADPNRYALSVRNCLREIQQESKGWDWGDVA
jgi:hypothetical protein